MSTGFFTIRVYGLLIKEDCVLLSRENIKGSVHTKFPGGGLEFGEGVVSCLKREFREEVGIELTRTEHFYTTEDYFPSAFHKEPKQVISIYYKVWSDQLNISTGNPAQTEKLKEDEDQILYWCAVDDLPDQGIDLPIDKIVAEKLLNS